LPGLFGALRRRMEARWGPPEVRRAHARVCLKQRSLADVVRTLERLWPAQSGDACTERPIFLLCAGWRSGSTLLQRLAVSSGQALVWGEPFAQSGLVQRLADSLEAVLPEWVPESFYFERWPPGTPLHDEFIANLYPGVNSLQRAHREFFNTLFAQPARASGFSRWGLKEVRLGSDHAAYLHWLFPAARTVFLYRNPYEAYRSYRKFRGWYYSWRDDPVMTPRRFGEIWAGLVRGFQCDAGRLGALLLKYEDLCSLPACREQLAEHTDIVVRAEVLDKRVGRLDRPGRGLSEVPAEELRVLRKAVDPLAGELGYECKV
jgi:hypothetical protein